MLETKGGVVSASRQFLLKDDRGVCHGGLASELCAQTCGGTSSTGCRMREVVFLPDSFRLSSGSVFRSVLSAGTLAARLLPSLLSESRAPEGTLRRFQTIEADAKFRTTFESLRHQLSPASMVAGQNQSCKSHACRINRLMLLTPSP